MNKYAGLTAILKRDFVAFFSNPTGYVFITVFVALGALGAFFLRDGRVPIGQAHRAKQDGITFTTQREGVVGQRLTGGVNACPADGGFGDIQLKSKLSLGRAEHLQCLADHLRSNTIARHRGDFIVAFTHLKCERAA